MFEVNVTLYCRKLRMPWQSSAQFADFVWRYVDVINQSVLLLQKVNCFQRSNETSDDRHSWNVQ